MARLAAPSPSPIALALGAAKTHSAAAPTNSPAGGPGAPSPPPGNEDAAGPDSDPVSSARRAAAAASDTPSSDHGRSVLEPALALAVVEDAGSLPGAGLGLEFGVLVRSGALSLRASGTLLLDRHVALPGGGDETLGADMALALGNLSACTTPVGDPLGFAGFACAGWGLGRLDAVGTGVEQPRRGSSLWSAPRVDAGLG